MATASKLAGFPTYADVAPVIARAPLVEAAKNQIFNVGADRPVSVMELAREVAAAFGVAADVKHLAARDEVVHAFADHKRVHEVFSPPNPIELTEGLKRMTDWIRSRGPATPTEFKGTIELDINLPESWRTVTDK